MSNKVPQIRFNGYSDAWEERKLRDLATSFEYGLNASATEFDGIHKYIRITDIDDSSRKFNHESLTSPDIDLSSADNYKLQDGDILFARTGASVGKTYIYSDSDGLVYYAGFLIRARIKSGVDSNFIFQHTLTSSYENFIRVTSQRSGQPGVNAKEYSIFEISVPSYEEQQRIGAFFKQLDDTIALHQRKLDLLKEQKKGYLQKMFPKNGAKVPELRFAGFDDAWEERKLGTIYDFGKGKGLPLDSFIYSSNNPAIAYGHLYTKYSEVISEVFWSSNDNGVLSKDNDLLFPGSSTVPNGTAQANAITLNNVKLGGDIIIGRPKEGVGVLSTFMSYQVNSQRQKLFPIIVGTTITHMYGKDISKLNFFITDYSEQEKIASFFKQLDDTIALHQRKLDLLKEQKRGFLQNMFI